MINRIAIVVLLGVSVASCDGQNSIPTMTPEQLYVLQNQCVTLGMRPVVALAYGKGHSVSCFAVYPTKKEVK